jgi:hypothetical protein
MSTKKLAPVAVAVSMSPNAAARSKLPKVSLPSYQYPYLSDE